MIVCYLLSMMTYRTARVPLSADVSDNREHLIGYRAAASSYFVAEDGIFQLLPWPFDETSPKMALSSQPSRREKPAAQLLICVALVSSRLCKDFVCNPVPLASHLV